MPLDPFESLPIGSTGVSVTRLGFGTAPIGGLYSAVSDAEGEAVSQHAWDMGVRYFDTAPLYGLGLSERRARADRACAWVRNTAPSTTADAG